VKKLVLGLLVGVAAAALSLLDLRDASACGMFFTKPLTEAEIAQKLPYLSVERVLLAWDPATQTEDFVRETRFEKADQAFGFVVPVPAQPEVFAVDRQPFDDLARAFPYVSEQLQGIGSGKGRGGAGEGIPAPVLVLSEQRIGSFTAFVLSARDSGGLTDWLNENGFRPPPAAQPWLDHYVHMGFFYVALRYDAPAAAEKDADARNGMTSQTVRIRFKTPLPYYPYLEPSRPGGAPQGERDLSLWYASRDERVPVAAFKSPDGTLAWKQPWSAGGVRHVTAKQVHDVSPALADIVTGDDDTPWVVVPYRDDKSSREGWGDVLLAPTQPLAADDAALTALWPLLPVLDPRLEGDMDQSPPPSLLPSVPSPVPPVPSGSAATSDASGGHGCSVSTSPATDSGAWSILAFSVLTAALARRRRRFVLCALLTMCGCGKPPATDRAVTPAPDASVVPGVPPSSRAQPGPVPAPPPNGDRATRERAVAALLFGRLDASRLSVDAAIRMASPDLPKVQEIGATVVGRLPTEVIQRIVRQNYGRFRLCYENGLRNDRGLKGKVAVRFGIDHDGSVGKVVDAGSDLADGPTLQCIVRGFGNLSFPPPESGSVTVTYRMSLDPPG
jgi:MYXO-CTERM domain-containing protein